MGTQQFYYMVFDVWRSRMGYVESHTLGTAYIKVGYDMEYSFHTTKVRKMF